jgi:hypothetical protein
MRPQRYLRLAPLAILVMAAACGSNVTAEDLAALADPVVEAQELLENFENQVAAGLTYGDMRTTWPPISAEVSGLLDDVTDQPQAVTDLPEADRDELLDYAFAVALAHDRWAATSQAVSDFLSDDGPESEITTAYSDATQSMEDLDDLRRAALEPGAEPTTTVTSP